MSDWDWAAMMKVSTAADKMAEATQYGQLWRSIAGAHFQKGD
jgi:hypothetical protein